MGVKRCDEMAEQIREELEVLIDYTEAITLDNKKLGRAADIQNIANNLPSFRFDLIY